MIRFILILVLAIAGLLALVAVRERSRGRLLASLVMLVIIVAGLPLLLWQEQVHRAATGGPKALLADAARTLDTVQVSSFDDVGACLAALRELAAYYARHPGAYPERRQAAQALLKQWQDYNPPADAANKHYCIDEKPLYRFVRTGHDELQELTRSRR